MLYLNPLHLSLHHLSLVRPLGELMRDFINVVGFWAVVAVIHYLIWGDFDYIDLPFILVDLGVGGLIVGVGWLLMTGFQKIKEMLKK